jgi:flap endonuclease-1
LKLLCSTSIRRNIRWLFSLVENPFANRLCRIPSDFLYQEARALFEAPDVLPADSVQLEWKAPDEDGLINFLVNEKQFDLGRVKSGMEKLKDAKKRSSQQRLESYFGAAVVSKRKATSSAPEKKPTKKRATKKK